MEKQFPPNKLKELDIKSASNFMSLIEDSRESKFTRVLRLFNFFWSVEKHDANPANRDTIGLAKSVKSVLICG